MLFNEVLMMFTECLVSILNYPALDIQSTLTPVVFSRLPVPTSSSNFEETRQHSQRRHGREPNPFSDIELMSRSKWTCVAQFYITSDKPEESAIIKSRIPPPLVNMWSRISKYSETEQAYEASTAKYHIIVGSPKKLPKWHSKIYKEVAAETGKVPQVLFMPSKQRFGYDWIPEADLELLDHTLVFSCFQPNNHSASIRVVNGWRGSLDSAIQAVNILESNPGVQWSIRERVSMPQSRSFDNPKELENVMRRLELEETTVKKLQAGLHTGHFTIANAARYLTANKFEDETKYENYVLGFAVVGNNVSLRGRERSKLVTPVLQFEVPNSRYVSLGQSQILKFVTAGDTNSESRFDVTEAKSLLSTLVDLIRAFDQITWICIGCFYPLPAFLFGVLYHGLLKKHMKHRLKYAPFTMGLKSLLGQSGDRMGNSRRVGFMTFLVVAWLLVGIVLSHAYRGNNIRAFARGSRKSTTLLKFGTFYTLEYTNISLVTDTDGWRNFVTRRNVPLLNQHPNFEGSSSNVKKIADFLLANNNVAFASWGDKVEETTYEMFVSPLWRRGTPQLTQGYYGFHGYNEEYYSGKRVTGWMTRSWYDSRLYTRVSALSESGIADMWKRVAKQITVLRNLARAEPWMYNSWYEVSPVALNENMVNLYLLGLCVFGAALAGFGLELIWFLIYTKERRHRKQSVVSSKSISVASKK